MFEIFVQSIIELIIHNVQMKNKLRNFDIQQKLGSGSYGVIYKAINKETKNVCVLKQIQLSRLSEKAKKNAVNEATILGKLNSAFIVQYIDSFIDDNCLNIIMEYCDGGDLAQFLKSQQKKALKEQKIWKIFLQICIGLDHIHQRKILHRDIKTLNIFLHKQDQIKIGDLGVAKMLQGHEFAQTMVGTPFYLSPQLCQEKPYNQKSDIWALGCLLYELCTYRHPFQAANQASLILKIIRGKYSPIPQFYSNDLKEVIDSCLERDYKRRPTTQMLLSRSKMKQMIEVFQFNKNTKKQISKAIAVEGAPQQIKNQRKQVIKKQPIKPIESVKIIKALDQGQKIEIVQKKQTEGRIIVGSNQLKKYQEINENNKMKENQSKPQNKKQFLSNLQKLVKNQEDNNKDNKQSYKKPSIYNQIPKNISEKHQSKHLITEKAQKVEEIKKAEVFVKIPLPQKQGKQLVNKVKMQKNIPSKVYQSNPNIHKSKGIIKSGGFFPQKIQRNEEKEKSKQKSRVIKNNDLVINRKQSLGIQKVQNNNNQKPIDKIQVKQKKQEIKEEFKSQRNLNKNCNTPMLINYAFNEKIGKANAHLPPRVRKGSKNQLSRNAKHLSQKTSVTKQQQEEVLNLPDIVNQKGESINSDQEKQSQNKFSLQQIDNEMIINKYAEIISSKQLSQHQTQNQIIKSQNIHKDSQQQLQKPQKQTDEQYNRQEEQIQQISCNNQSDYNESQVYQINPFDLQNKKKQEKQQINEEWSFNEQAELPMLEQIQVPFQQANPYLMEQNAEQEAIEGQKNYLTIKLQENLKREDEINQLMQIKITQCKQSIPLFFDEILVFFRNKINMDQDEQDERQVENFLKKKGLTDHRKLQNIYKIMHFEMELENTRKIIQRICKRLNELQS